MGYLIDGIHNHNARLGVFVGQKTVGELNQGIKVTHYITLKHRAKLHGSKEEKSFSVIYKYLIFLVQMVHLADMNQRKEWRNVQKVVLNARLTVTSKGFTSV